MENKLPADIQKKVDDCVTYCAEKQNHLTPHIAVRAAVEAWAENYATLRARSERMEKALKEALVALENCYDVTEHPANGETRQDEAIRIICEARALEGQPVSMPSPLLTPGAPTETGCYWGVLDPDNADGSMPKVIIHYLADKNKYYVVGHAFKDEVKAEDIVGYIKDEPVDPLTFTEWAMQNGWECRKGTGWMKHSDETPYVLTTAQLWEEYRKEGSNG